MLESMNQASPSTNQRQDTRLGKVDDVADAAAPVRNTTGELPSIDEHTLFESALAYDLLLPRSATAIASIRVAGDPVLSRLRRDDATMVWCRLTGDETTSEGIDSSEGFAEMTSDGRSLPFAPASLDCVVLHGTLDKWRNAQVLLSAIRVALKPGGVVALAVANRLDPAHFRRRLGSTGGGNEENPIGRRRSLWGYRRLLQGCGLSPTASYFVLQDPGAAPTRIISTCYAPSTAFFRLQSSALTGPRRLLMLGLNAVNLLPHAQSRFLILAGK